MIMDNWLDLCRVELENGFTSQYIGITICDGKPQIVFPRGYNLSLDKRNQRKDIILLIKVFDKYIKRKKEKGYIQELKEILGNEGDEFPFESALWMIKNYENNGLYKECVYNYNIDKKGKINWSRTIKKQNPYISNNKLVYLDFVVKEKRNNLNNMIILAQKYIIEKCIENIGWLYPNIYIERGNKLPCNIDACINILRKELRLTNIDSKKELISHIIEFLKYASNNKSNKKLKEYKTKYFMNIWEDMLNEVLGNEKANEYYPSAKWIINGNPTDASNLKPDIILKMEDRIYVVDAKYYKYGITNNISDLPQSSDISKQLLYSEYIQSNFKLESYDCFILPFKKEQKEYFKFVGNATMDNIDKFKWKKVVCILADTKRIMEQYVNMNNLDESKKSVKDIIDNQNKKNN